MHNISIFKKCIVKKKYLYYNYDCNIDRRKRYGNNTFKITVTAGDLSSKEYTITVNDELARPVEQTVDLENNSSNTKNKTDDEVTINIKTGVFTIVIIIIIVVLALECMTYYFLKRQKKIGNKTIFCK